MNETFTAEDLAALVAGHMSKPQLLDLIKALEETASFPKCEQNNYAVCLLENGFYSWTGENIR